MASRSCNKPMVKMDVERTRKIFGERHILCSSNCGISNICINVVTSSIGTYYSLRSIQFVAKTDISKK
jgi:hypothetical protein